jgi:hypothetical protein
MTSTKRTATPATANKPKTHDDYLAAVTEDKRAALQKLRKAIKTAEPKAEECISYQLPAFRLMEISRRLRCRDKSLCLLSWPYR